MNSVIGALRVNLGIDTAEFQDGLKKAQAGLAKFGNLARQGLEMAAEAAGEALVDLARSVKDTIDAADGMGDIAERLGIPIEELSRLKYAAEMSGASMDALEAGFERLARNMSAAKDGIGPAAKMFEDLGISVTKSDGSLKSIDDILPEIADRFAAMPDGVDKAARAMRLLGSRGAELVPMLNKGGAALADLKAEASTFGQVFTAEMGENAGTFNDNIDKLRGTMGAISAKIATELLPHLAGLSEWLVANAPAILKFAADFTRIAAAVGSFAVRIGEAVAAFGPFGEAMTLGVFGLLRFGERIVAVAVRFANFFADIAQQILGFLAGAWASFEAAWDGLAQKVNQVANDIVATLAALPAQMIEIGSAIVDGLWQGIVDKWNTVKYGVGELAGGLVQAVKEKLGIKSPSQVFFEIGQNIAQGLSLGIGGVGKKVEKEVGGAIEKVNSSMQSLFSSFGSGVAAAIKGTKKWSEVLTDLLSQLGSHLMQTGLKALFGGSNFGGFLSGLLGGLVGFANGGSFQVSGAGGIDSQIVAFRASPNETVKVTKPGQGGGGGGDMHITVGWSRTADGNLRPFVESVSRHTAAPMVQSGMQRANQAVIPTVARYQSDQAGSDYRVA